MIEERVRKKDLNEATVNARGLKKRRRLWYAEKRVSIDVKGHFGKARFSRSMETDSLPEAIKRSEPLLKQWTYLIEMARLKNNGQIVDLDQTAEAYAKQFNDLGKTQLAAASIAEKLNPEEEGLSAQQDKDRVEVWSRAVGNLTPFAKHSDQFFDAYGYSDALAYEARRFIEIRFAKKFKYFETVTVEELKAYIKVRMDGSDGSRAWSESSVTKNIGFIKAYWIWCLDNELITAPNMIDLPRLMQRKNKTKNQKKKTKKEANIAYTVSEAWQLHAAAERKDQKLADLIMLGMYTGCRIGELCSLTLKGVTEDRFLLEDTKTDAGDRGIPIHTDIQQMVERLKQTSTDGYLIPELSDANATKDRSKGIGKRFGYLKRSLGFADKIYSFHSFRSTLASRFQDAGVSELYAARVLGHAAGGMTYGLYAGDLDFDEKVKAMAKVRY